MAHPRIQIIGLFGNFKVGREVTDFGFALNPFDLFRFCALLSVLSTTGAPSVGFPAEIFRF